MKTLLLGVALTNLVWAAQPLVSVDDMVQLADVRVLDIRVIDQYLNGHIPGAVSAPYGDGWRTTMNGIGGMMPHVPVLEQKIANLGVSNDDWVVLASSGSNANDYAAAARVYWTFKMLGHDQVSILNGGMAAWQAQGLAVEQDLVRAVPTDFTANLRPEYLMTTEQILAAGDQLQLIDSRPAALYDGDEKFADARVAGTVPGAKNFVHTAVYQTDGPMYFADAASISSKAVAAGIDLQAGATAAFCNTGHLGATQWFVFSEILGLDNVSMYDGSVVEWTADPERPVQTKRRGLGRLFGG